jgi:hypothetical protein
MPKTPPSPWLKRGILLAAAIVAAYALWEVVRPPHRPDFTGTDLNGRSWSLAEHRGSKPVVLNFFGTT